MGPGRSGPCRCLPLPGNRRSRRPAQLPDIASGASSGLPAEVMTPRTPGGACGGGGALVLDSVEKSTRRSGRLRAGTARRGAGRPRGCPDGDRRRDGRARSDASAARWHRLHGSPGACTIRGPPLASQWPTITSSLRRLRPGFGAGVLREPLDSWRVPGEDIDLRFLGWRATGGPLSQL